MIAKSRCLAFSPIARYLWLSTLTIAFGCAAPAKRTGETTLSAGYVYTRLSISLSAKEGDAGGSELPPGVLVRLIIGRVSTITAEDGTSTAFLPTGEHVKLPRLADESLLASAIKPPGPEKDLGSAVQHLSNSLALIGLSVDRIFEFAMTADEPGDPDARSILTAYRASMDFSGTTALRGDLHWGGPFVGTAQLSPCGRMLLLKPRATTKPN